MNGTTSPPNNSSIITNGPITHSAVAVLNCSKVNMDILCILSCVMTGLSVVTVALSIVSLIRISRYGKGPFARQMIVHYSVILQALAQLVYFGVWDNDYLHTGYEVMKIITFICVGYFFSESAHRLGLLPNGCNGWFIGISHVLYIGVVISGAVFASLHPELCHNIGRLLFASSQFCFAVFFGGISYRILRTVTRGTAGMKKALSQSFMIRHTQPLTIVLVVYSWTSTVNLGLAIFMFCISLGTDMNCHEVLLLQSYETELSYPIFKQIDEIVPLWAILWFFFSATSLDKHKYKLVRPIPEPSPLSHIPQQQFSFSSTAVYGYNTRLFTENRNSAQ